MMKSKFQTKMWSWEDNLYHLCDASLISRVKLLCTKDLFKDFVLGILRLFPSIHACKASGGAASRHNPDERAARQLTSSHATRNGGEIELQHL